YEIGNLSLSSTTCHVIANRKLYRYSESNRSVNIGECFFNKLKERFKSDEWFDPGISVSSHPCSRSNSPPLTLEKHRDYSREVKFDPVIYPIDFNIESSSLHLEIDPRIDKLNVCDSQLGIDDIDPVCLEIDQIHHQIDSLRITSHLAVDNSSLLLRRKKRKLNRQCSKNCSYFQLAFLLFLIAFGQNGLLSSGVLKFHRKSTGLSVFTIGMVIGAVRAAPVDLIGDTGIRAERSANLSHITGASRKIQMYVKNRYLQILPNGTVNGSNDDASDYTIFQRMSVSRGQLRIQGVATCLYLCMDSCGLLYGSHEYTEDCIFNETIEQHNYNTYSSVRWSTNQKTLYLGLNRYGEPRRVQAKGHNLGRLSAYSRVLTMVVSPDRVETLHRRMFATHHNVRHRHNAHHQHKQQNNLCPRIMQLEKDNVDNNYRCRKRKKRRKRKRKCQEDESPGPQCEHHHHHHHQQNHHHIDSGSSEGLPESKRSCEDAASDEVCRRQAMDAASKKRKSRMEKVGRNQHQQQQHHHHQPRDSKKGKKQPSTKKPNTDLAEHEDEKEKKPDSMNGKKKPPGFKRTSLQAKKKLPGRTTASSTVPKEPQSTSPSSWLHGVSTKGSAADATTNVTSGSTNSTSSSKDILRASLSELSSPLDSTEDDQFDASYSNEEINSSLEYGGITLSGSSAEVSDDDANISTPRTMRLIKAGKLKDSTTRLAM
ncbi:uncharacterized protein LOC127282598, partial [Leptopilina boulardi]|uniref:uncharacterized protein LOC127282598 n=1 Tax=Leptopilina boulardi TaxID=63433 RepID=UPI0021F6288C